MSSKNPKKNKCWSSQAHSNLRAKSPLQDKVRSKVHETLSLMHLTKLQLINQIYGLRVSPNLTILH